jgi:transcriptional regulator with PAS, ATPase and Fis domain
MDEKHAWIEGLPVAITVTDASGRILAMNARSIETFAKDGGAALIGRSLFDCHPEPARAKTEALYEKKAANHYTIRKDGQKKVIHQLPWYGAGGAFAGFVEISVPIPDEMAHFDRS